MPVIIVLICFLSLKRNKKTENRCLKAVVCTRRDSMMLSSESKLFSESQSALARVKDRDSSLNHVTGS